MRGLILFSVITATFAAPQYSYQLGDQQGLHQGPVIYNKQYYIHSAPDDALEPSAADQSLLANKRNLRVVFIKTPENRGLENAALQLAKAAGDDRTAIYVLNKQTDLAELQNKLSQITDQNANKPEVHFVKYRTPEEAEHAQQYIKSQYDTLGGPSQVVNEGIAPVRNFVGSLAPASSVPAYDNTAIQNSRTQNDYLPPQ
ncbi:uncharacterized protein LOC129613786 [Condylostylus longicornis]|uniref:uncharacterized protein LOC129613786 n=1 Tax=Condylostylus longicornis TaxID=2530218 RepID=UPI00244E085A|nr:uncharacterized protein LOC129613786 [Condylostylus longicornis]